MSNIWKYALVASASALTLHVIAGAWAYLFLGGLVVAGLSYLIQRYVF